MKKVISLIAVTSASTYNAFGAMTADPDAGLTAIEGFADAAIGVAIAIGVVVIGWSYVKRLVKKG
tara:strand:- start:9 stop:203 length:195 start_codon:yes stop_codon:yes gene_type:complete